MTRVVRALTSVLSCLSAFACESSPPGGAAARARVSADSSEVAIRRLWDEYLRSKHGQFAANAGTPSTLWSASEQLQWPMYDLAGFYLPDGAVPEVMRVESAAPVSDSEYEIVTRFWDSGGSTKRAVLTMTVFARQERGRWVLANALPRRTGAWGTEKVGSIQFRVAPRLKYDSVKARHAAVFVDSLARAFSVPAPPRLEYYVAESVDQALEILGLEFPVRYGAAGGFAKPVNGQVFSGIPAHGENYRHELSHVVLYSVLRGAETSLLASEGVATWLGGTAGGDFRSAVQRLESVMRAQPDLTLDAIIDGAEVPQEIRYAAGGVLAQMLNEASGAPSLREFLRAGSRPTAIRTALERLMERPWSTIVADWRARVARLAAT